MLVGCLQFAPEFGAPDRNLERIAELVRGTEADLLVLPELATTGYLFADRAEAAEYAETVPDGPSTRALADLARERDVLLCYGIAEKRGDRVFNSAVLVGPEGHLLTYRKVHPFADEKDIYDDGDAFPVVDLPGGAARVGMLVCFDWVFPEAFRSLALQGAELILHPSNLVLPHCQKAMVTRSIENGVFTVTANRIGREERAGKGPLVYTGKSQVISPRGETLDCLDDEEGVALAEIDPAESRDKRLTERNSLLTDRKPELYGLLTDTPDGGLA